MSNLNYSLDFELNDNNYLSNLFGIDDRNIQIIEKINNVKIKYRGNKIKIIGRRENLPQKILDIILKCEKLTSNNTSLILNLAFKESL